MANRTFYPSMSYGSSRVYAECELLGAGAAALTIGQGANIIASIVRSGVGVFVVTLKDAFNRVIYKGAELDDTLNDGSYATCSDVTNEGTATPIVFTIRTRSASGAAADPAVGRRIGVTLAFRNGNWGVQ
jgi:hypothetical protein